jgi:hypothetical protein
VTLDQIIVILGILLPSYLMWRTNALFKEQNRIMSDQLAYDTGNTAAAILRSSRLRYNWPMITMALLTFCTWAAVGTWIYIRHSAATVTPSNVESKVKTWLEEFNYGTQVIHDPSALAAIAPNAYFFIVATNPSGRKISIWQGQTKDARERYIHFRVDAAMDQKHKDDFNLLSEQEKQDLMEQLGFDLWKARTHSFDLHIPEGISMLSSLAVTNDLTEDAFIKAVDEINLNGLIAIEQFNSDLKGFVKNHKIKPLDRPAVR